MAGVGIVKAEYDSEYQAILDALSKASAPDLLKIAMSAGGELDYITHKAFEKEQDPVTGEKWESLKRPNKSGKILHGKPAHLKRSLIWEAFPDGSVIYGSNVIYARRHQKGDEDANIPPRPYLGVPRDFDRQFLNDPKILEILGLG